CAGAAVCEAPATLPPACGVATAGGKGVDEFKRLSGIDLDDGAAGTSRRGLGDWGFAGESVEAAASLPVGCFRACSRSPFRSGALGRSKARPARNPTPKTSSSNATGNILSRL